MSFRRIAMGLSLAGLGLVGCRAGEAPEGEGPRLVVLVVVDQLGADLLERADPVLRGGLRRLLDEGVVFTAARHLHAETTTGPGHATAASGCHPARHGIVGNSWYEIDRRDWVYCCEDDAEEESPARLLVSTLGDWIAQASPRSRVFSVSGKDRSAILMGGHSADGAYWYDWEGGWETSAYYDGEPSWVEAFNAQDLLDERFGTAWEPVAVPEAELSAMGVLPFDFGPLEEDLPHTFGGTGLAPGRGFYGDLFTSPWLDRHMALFAEALIEAEELGRDGAVDYLALGFSALDPVGHTYGPESREVLDAVIRLDQILDRLFGFLDRTIGLEHVVVGLTADHGAVPTPEVQNLLGRPGERVGQETVLCLQSVGRRLAEKFGDESWLLPGPSLDPVALVRSGVSRSVLERETALLAEACPGVEKVWTRGELLAAPAGDASDSDARRLAVNSFHPERSPDFRVEFEPGFVPVAGVASTHGSAHDYDTRVPLIFWANGLEPRTVARPAGTVDLAPTLAALAGIAVPEGLDGADLTSPPTGAGAGEPAPAAAGR